MQLRLPWARGPTNNPDEENDETNENRNDILQEIEAYGDQIASKLDGQVRIGFQNINGITKSAGLIGAEELEAMNEMNFDLIGMIETNVNWNHDARNYLHSAAHLRFNNTSRCVMSSSRASPNDTYLPGGTAMITQGKFSGRIISRGMDRLGSFTWMAIRGKKDIGVIAFTAWRVEVGMWDVGACRRTWAASAAAAVAGAVGRMGCRIGLVASAALVAPAGFGLLAAVVGS